MSVALVPAADLADSLPAPVAPVRTVLVSTDFSAIGNRAIAHACSILEAGGRVILTHVIDSPGLVYERDWADRGSRPVPGTEEESAARRRLDALVPPDAAARGIAFRTEVLFGLKVADAICQAAERHAVDVICIGSHGRSGAARLLLGSVAREVIDRSRKPVFLVKAAQS
jgi:nucleotide-binding universal stress UspA family protein